VARDRLIARRKALGFTQQSLAHCIPCERSTVARWERGESVVSAYHREPLARELKLTLPDLDTLLNGDTSPQPERGLWSGYATLEQSSTSVRTWQPMLVPGLLQTRDYAAALLDDIDLVTRRMDRQRIVTRAADPVELAAVLDESTLHRPIGGPAVLAGQLRHLAAAAELPNVTVQVLPLDGPTPAVARGGLGPVVILGFPWPGGLVYLEYTGGATYRDTLHDVRNHATAFDQMRELALPPDESVALIATRARELESGRSTTLAQEQL
jgi:transcriptional regulator with XRE-family HTH domain